MSTDLQWLPLYVDDFLGDETVKVVSNRALGCYMRLLCHQWTHRTIPSDLRHLARIAHENEDDFGPIWEELEHKFHYRNGRLANRRLEAVRREQDRKHRKQSEGGRLAQAKLGAKRKLTRTEVEVEVEVEPEEETTTTESKAIVPLHVE